MPPEMEKLLSDPEIVEAMKELPELRYVGFASPNQMHYEERARLTYRFHAPHVRHGELEFAPMVKYLDSLHVGTVELYDETMTLLAARLGVPLTDVLYVSAKNASARGAAEQGERHVAAGAAQLARVRAAYGADFERHQTR